MNNINVIREYHEPEQIVPNIAHLLETDVSDLSFKKIKDILNDLFYNSDYSSELGLADRNFSENIIHITSHSNDTRMAKFYSISSHGSLKTEKISKMALLIILRRKVENYISNPSNKSCSEVIGILVTLYHFQAKEEKIEI